MVLNVAKPVDAGKDISPAGVGRRVSEIRKLRPRHVA